jgi:hypothetical protein
MNGRKAMIHRESLKSCCANRQLHLKVPILSARPLFSEIVVSEDSDAEASSSTSPPMRPERLCVLAQRFAKSIPDFFNTKGPGKGDHATAEFLRSVREAARGMFGTDYSEKPACTSAGFRFDFFFPEEAVALEFAFGLHNPNSEFERDIFKCLLAIDDGCSVKRLMLIGKPGAIGRLSAPAPKAIMASLKSDSI